MADRLVYTAILVILIAVFNPEPTLGFCVERRSVQPGDECECVLDPSSAVTSGTATLSSGSRRPGSTATVNCNTGYASATTRITCQSYGLWSTAVCSAPNCGSYSNAVTDGTADASSPTTYLSTSTVTCNQGYTNPTPTRITCQANGDWSTASCSRINCGSIPSSAVTFGSASPSSGSTTYQSTATVTCITGYTSTITTIVCQANGQWSTATCFKKDCSVPPNITDGSVSYTETTYKAVATYTCNTWHIISGTVQDTTTTRTCNALGVWSGQVPACVIKANPLGAVCPNPSSENLSPTGLCTGEKALCLTRSSNSLDYTCQCESGYYDNNGDNAGGSCSPISDLKVQSITFESITTNSMTLSWQPPVDKQSFVDSYIVEWKEKGKSIKNGITPVLMATTYTIDDSLTSGRAYTVTVISRNSVDYTSTIKTTYDTKEQAIKPQTPGAINTGSSDLNAVDEAIFVVWTGSAGNVSGYEWKLEDGNTELISDTTASSSANISNSEIKNGYRYNISITALSQMFENGSIIRSGTHIEEIKTVVTVPSSPQQVDCHMTTDSSITIKWLASLQLNGDLIDYKIDTYRYGNVTVLKTERTGSLALMYEITGLQPGSYYYFNVSTINENYTSQPTRLSIDFCATRADVSDIPNNLNVDNVQSRSFVVSWTKPTNTYGENIGYVVQVRTDDDPCVMELIRTCNDCTQQFNVSALENMCPPTISTSVRTPKSSIDSDELQTYNVTGLKPYFNYTVTVTAVNQAGRGKVARVIVQTDEEAEPLGAVCLNPANTNATASELCNGFHALCDGKTTSGNEFTCQCTTGFYDDNGDNAAGSCKPISDLQVQSITFASVSISSMIVSWSLPADKQNLLDSYMVEWREKGNYIQGGISSVLKATTYTITNSLTSGRAYTVKVISRNNVSYASTVKTTFVSKEQALKPQTPGAVIASRSDLDADDKSINVTWTGSVGDVSGYEWKLQDGNQVLRTGTTTSSTASIIYSGMKNGYRYIISITALSQMFDNDKTIRSETHTGELKTVVKAPSEPQWVECQTTTYTSVTIKWGVPLLPNGDLQEYMVETYVLDTNSKLKTERTGSLELTYRVAGLQPGSFYYFYVYAVNEQYPSILSRQFTALCATRANVPEMPTKLNVSDVRSRSLVISWTKPNNTFGENVGYIVQVWTDNERTCIVQLIRKCSDCTQTFDPSTLINMCPDAVSITDHQPKTIIDSDTEQTFSVSGLEPDTSYTVNASAVNAAGKGTHAYVLVTTGTEAAYGARCDFNTVCLPKSAECIEGKCLCKTGIIDWKNNQCDRMPLFEYGIEDTLVDTNAACSGPVVFQPGFTLFGATRRSVHICSNGYVSLDKPYTGPKPPRDISTLEDFVILAPYYADASRESRNVYYRYFDITNDKGIDLDREDAVNITQFVRRFGGKTDFQPVFMLFVTWAKMRPFERSFNGTSTFQLILVSDGTITFAVYIYEYGGMLLTSSLPRPAIWSGYYASADQFESSLYSFSQQALHMDTYAKTKGVQGVTLHRLNTHGEGTPAEVINGIKCNRWYNINSMKQLDVTNIPDCPCDIAKLWLDPWYTDLESQPNIPDIACSTILAAGSFSPFGKNCCYNKTTGLWVQDRPYAGTVFQYHQRAFPREHQIHDIDAKTYCCYKSNLCDKYYELHPIGTCYSRSWFEIGTVWGDPHFRTLDNGSFTFNGLGEFHLLQVEKPDTQGGLFQLQARTERPLKPNKALSEATVFSAFAASDGMGANFHVQLNQNKSEFVIYENRTDLSKKFRKQEFTYDRKDGNLSIVKRGETLTVVFPSFGISLNVSINVRMLSIVVILNEEFIGRTKGLLGNFNGDPADDFVLPNGTHRQANMTEQEIFYYGKEWSVDSNSSVFFYPKGKGHSDYHNSSYVPRFLEDVPIEKRNNATKHCGRESNVQCIYDFVFTEDEEIANQTSNTGKTSLGDKMEIKQKIPMIEGCELKTIKLGEEVVCQLSVSNDTDTIFVDGLDGVSHDINQDNHTLTFNVIDIKPFFISVSAHSANGKQSPKKPIKIILCSSCSNHGVCSSSQNRLETYSSPFFRLAQCTCDPGYDGPDCDLDYDGCSSKPCSLLRNCTDLSPEEHVQRNISHVCGPCPVGYTTVDEDECVDIDECAESNDCQDICINTEGGYECGCGTGYRLDTANGRLCDDINECEEALHACEHKCMNTNGSYRCTCREGFSLNKTGLKCLQNDEDVCSQLQIDCSNATGCTINANNTPVCFCKNGFRLTNNFTCEDIDECEANICPQDCLNTIGSFNCMCHSGYRLVDKTTCVPCDYLAWGLNCSNICDCPNANACDTVKGCVCKTGWVGDRCDEDINECQIVPNICPDARDTCMNIDGSYYCACIDGYSRPEGSTAKCTDECSSPRLHDCEHFCNNTIGGYTCSCPEGYTIQNDTHCKDVNECDLQTAGCQHICENFEGGFNCYCEFGYILNDDRKTCTEDDNPCLSANLTCSQVCITDIETRALSCGCEPGYTLAADNVTCSDTNECEDSMLNRCGSHSKCINEMGSFRCECQKGFKLQTDERTCRECDEFHFGENCRDICSCVRGTCDNEIGCICNDGWTGDYCDQEIDECQTLEEPCVGDNVHCQNSPGGYVCRCLAGFHNVSGDCQDIDECIQDNTNNCDQRCENSDGSYKCLCNNGFIRKNDHCEDFDECSKQHDCAQNCDNTIGSDRCSCKTGYKLDLNSRRSCLPITECNSTMIDICETQNANCLVTDNKQICNCWKGYEDSSTSGSCSDIDECIENPCEHTCENMDGAFSCSCYDGYQLDVDKTTCTECQPFYYGQECSQRCTCNLTNTESCNNTNGICNCREGWTSDDCSEDIDECMSGSHSCSNILNSECENSPGTYMCTCLSGYALNASLCIDIDECMDDTSDCSQDCENTDGSFICKCSDGYRSDGGHCTECADNMFGFNCSEQCTCYTNNTVNTTQSCDPPTGVCHCKQGWTGLNCSVDVNECVNTDLCNDVPSSDCHNIEGGYSCECLRGYTKGSNGECTADTLPSTTTPSAPRLKEVRLQITLAVNLPAGTNLNVGTTYTLYETDVLYTLKAYYGSFGVTEANIFINSLSRGSLKVDYNLTYKNERDVDQAIGAATIRMVQGVDLVFQGETVSSHLDVPENVTDLCEIYLDLFGQCEAGLRCTVGNDEPTCSKESDVSVDDDPTTDDNFTVIIIVSTVGFVLLVSIIVLVVCIKVMRKRREQKKHQNTSSNDTSRRRVSINNKSTRGTYDRSNMSHVRAGWRHVGTSDLGNLEDQEMNKDRLQGHWHSGIGGKYTFYQPQLSTFAPTVARRDSTEARNTDEEYPSNAY